jgi:hypothetical protein
MLPHDVINYYFGGRIWCEHDRVGEYFFRRIDTPDCLTSKLIWQLKFSFAISTYFQNVYKHILVEQQTCSPYVVTDTWRLKSYLYISFIIIIMMYFTCMKCARLSKN